MFYTCPCRLVAVRSRSWPWCSGSLKMCVQPFLTTTKVFPSSRKTFSSRNSTEQLKFIFKLEELQERGLVEHIFPRSRITELQPLLSSPQGMYCGFDPTADSLHIGNLISLLVLLHGQRAGHSPITVVGGATAMIGDPSGKSNDRVLMSAEDVENNTLKLTENINRIFHNHAEYINKDKKILTPHRVLNNADWYKSLNVIDFMSTTCRHFRLGDMLKKQSVQSRLQAPQGGMSCTEFMYQVFQASDWLHLYQQHNCTIQIGGNDQTGNITSGFELIRDATKDFTFGLLVPLLLDEKGSKLGKSTGNSIWLDPNKSSPFDMYQFFFNLSDANVEKFIKMFTFLTQEEIEAVMIEQKQAAHERHAQKKIAQQVTLLVHGDSGLNAALMSTEILFGKNPVTHLKKMPFKELQQLFGSKATFDLHFDSKMSILDLIKKIAPLSQMLTGKQKKGKDGLKADVERLIKSGGLHINQQRVADPKYLLGNGDFVLPNGITLIRLGKKNYSLIKWQF